MNAPPGGRRLVEAFPTPGRLVEQAYRELHIAQTGTETDKQALGPALYLPRPWEPATCTHPMLRAQVWEWLEQVVIWVNHDHTWQTEMMIPPCWPAHPHLVHEIAVLADRRRHAHHALAGDVLEEWQRIHLPGFIDRMRARLHGACTDHDHQPWPGQARHTRHTDPAAHAKRHAAFDADLAIACTLPADPSLEPPPEPPPELPSEPEDSGPRRLYVINGEKVNTLTGEVIDE